MKFYDSIAAGAWTNLLGFEVDPDHSPDPGTGNGIYTRCLSSVRPCSSSFTARDSRLRFFWPPKSFLSGFEPNWAST